MGSYYDKLLGMFGAELTPERMVWGIERENIRKMVELISGEKDISFEDPRYVGQCRYVTDEMADLALKLERRKPYTLAQLAALAGKTEDELKPLVDQMSIYGLLEYERNEHQEKEYVLPIYIVGVGEYGVNNLSLLAAYPEVTEMFSYASLVKGTIAHMIPPGGGGGGMHTIPVEKAINPEQESIPREHISYWLDKYDKYAIMPCSCRLSEHAKGRVVDDDMVWCVALGEMADYVVETQKEGRYVTKAETLDILRQAEANGFVHQTTNQDGPDKVCFICNCNLSSCYALRSSQLFNAPNANRSAYVAQVNKDNCVACGKCVEKCPAGAVKLGQKLCTKDGAIEYPQQDSPFDMEWGVEKWNPNYRDDNRVNTHKTGTAPCKTACPANISVQGYLNMAAQGRYEDALKLIKKDNPFPAICGRICNRRCEEACTRGTIDEAIAIDEVKKFIAEWELREENRFIPPVERPSLTPFTQKIAIVGAGPAGMSCAFYLAEKGYTPTIFEKNEKPGGMLTYGVPSYKLEKDVIAAEIDVLQKMGIEFKCGVEVGKDVTLAELRAQGYAGFYLAIGCQGSRLAGIPGEDAKGVTTAVDFLRNVNTGLTQVLGRTVVIGGGNVAVDAARCAVRSGSAEVRMFCLESRDTMPASEEEIQEALEDNVQLECGWGPKEILVKKGVVSGIVLKKCKSVFAADGKFAPTYDESNTITIECDNVVMSIGQSILWGELLAASKVELERGGMAKADPITYQTAQEDIFVGGDVYTGPKFAIDAIAAGKDAALSLHRFVQGSGDLAMCRSRRDFIELDKENIVVPEYDNSIRQHPRSDIDRRDFRDVRKPLTEEQVKIETARCLGCGVSVVDTNRCLGCGICTTRCAFEAITLSRDLPEMSNMVSFENRMEAIIPYTQKREAWIAKNA
jgi:NADPH-dependent glutamate synthase beta subunit-like oxidoreductase